VRDTGLAVALATCGPAETISEAGTFAGRWLAMAETAWPGMEGDHRPNVQQSRRFMGREQELDAIRAQG
jgi:hypothetical protein